jgi:hypothetical protein
MDATASIIWLQRVIPLFRADRQMILTNDEAVEKLVDFAKSKLQFFPGMHLPKIELAKMPLCSCLAFTVRCFEDGYFTQIVIDPDLIFLCNNTDQLLFAKDILLHELCHAAITERHLR